jgi:hypothetical protein
LAGSIQGKVTGAGMAGFSACDDVEVEVVVTRFDSFDLDYRESGLELEGKVLLAGILQGEGKWEGIAYVGDFILVGVFEENEVLHKLASLGITSNRKSNDMLLNIPEAIIVQ